MERPQHGIGWGWLVGVGILLGLAGIFAVFKITGLTDSDAIGRAGIYVNIAYTVLTGCIFLAAIWGVQQQVRDNYDRWARERKVSLYAEQDRRAAVAEILLNELQRLHSFREQIITQLANAGQEGADFHSIRGGVGRVLDRQEIDHAILSGDLLAVLPPRILRDLSGIKTCLWADRADAGHFMNLLPDSLTPEAMVGAGAAMYNRSESWRRTIDDVSTALTEIVNNETRRRVHG